MKKSILSFVTAAALSGTFAIGASASSEEVTVKKGDTLWDISQKHNISVNDLKEWNNLSSNLIRPDERVKVALTEQYHIQKGDTLSEIALDIKGISWKTLQQWNNIENADLIYAGDVLTVYLKGVPNNNSTSTVETEKKEEKKEVVEKIKTEEKEEQSTSDQTKKEQPSSEKEEVVEEKKAEESNSEEKNSEQSSSDTATAPDKEVAQELTMTATAYTATCEGCSGITSTGINLLENPDMKVVSVDPSVIPLGSKVYVEGYGEAIAGDTGGAIIGNKIDIFIPNLEGAINWGVKEVKVKVYK
ncbi:3D domain-containing protein [Bacillus sp. FJAT-45066]|uniref:3D domain-containing protein n=1 Tax=Bacillus sp. FJAT-45066 TaxID=2011010 RepID=UPI000BB884AD|nr:3D domain-containing protein [Bacillus sp. FJAT-45066]